MLCIANPDIFSHFPVQTKMCKKSDLLKDRTESAKFAKTYTNLG